MSKIFTFLVFGLALLAWPVHAQDYDESYVFVDKNGNVIENESTVICNTVEQTSDGSDVIYSGVSVKNVNNASDYLKMVYVIEQIDNGTYQICFPMTCNMQTEDGYYETAIGQLMEDVQSIQSEWFPTEDGECVVTLLLELYERQGSFPPSYVLKAYGPSITLYFVKGGAPVPGKPGDVNGDGEVNIADINAVIDSILSQSGVRAADVNGDGEINIADVNAVINYILS